MPGPLISSSDFTSLIVFASLLLVLIWGATVSQVIPDPYLDEVFHIPQAQAYWNGAWQTWDPKITTPPGLYIYSYAARKIQSLVYSNPDPIRSLRFTNTFLLPATWPVLRSITCSINQENEMRRSSHVAANIILFPLLFFFSALYYTDVLSTVLVTYVYFQHLQFNAKRRPAWRSIGKCYIFVLGLLAMLVRQTNVFWVAVFLAGLQAIQSLKTCAENERSPGGKPGPPRSALYDPPGQGAGVEDYLKLTISLASAAASHLTCLFIDLVPHIALVLAFTVFVMWNGGVVLGDKENHVASIHFPQILYIWPCIVFFSWPVLLPTLAAISWARLPRLLVAIPIMLLMLASVHFNTIVHPFTLADNRHYVFYVFRLLLRYTMLKYAAVPVYFACGWLVIASIGSEAGIAAEKSAKSTRPSFVLAWFGAAFLSLATAPLVEPRYFIIPWLIWRLHVPLQNENRPKDAEDSFRRRIYDFAVRYQLFIESAWYLFINVIAGYMFLCRGFGWPQEPGKVQRFIW